MHDTKSENHHATASNLRSGAERRKQQVGGMWALVNNRRQEQRRALLSRPGIECLLNGGPEDAA